MLDTAGACSFGTKEIIPEGGSLTPSTFRERALSKVGATASKWVM